jgi:fibronectin-binding autotransporter adhesin
MVLSGSNTYSGGTAMESGILKIASTNALGTGQLTLSGGTLVLNSLLTLSSLNWTNGSSSNATIAIDDLVA